MFILRVTFWIIRGVLSARADSLAENLALRQQLVVLPRGVKRPKVHRLDRCFWVWLSRFWKDWRSVVLIVQPDTVVRWQREGVRLYWKWKSRPDKVGRPQIDKAVRNLICQLSKESPLWSAPRIQAELHLLGHDVAPSTVAKYMAKPRKPPSQTWRTFLKNHAHQRVAVDFFTVPTIRFQILYCFLMLRHNQRQVVHFNGTVCPTSPAVGTGSMRALRRIVSDC